MRASLSAVFGQLIGKKSAAVGNRLYKIRIRHLEFNTLCHVLGSHGNRIKGKLRSGYQHRAIPITVSPPTEHDGITRLHVGSIAWHHNIDTLPRLATTVDERFVCRTSTPASRKLHIDQSLDGNDSDTHLGEGGLLYVYAVRSGVVDRQLLVVSPLTISAHATSKATVAPGDSVVSVISLTGSLKVPQ